MSACLWIWAFVVGNFWYLLIGGGIIFFIYKRRKDKLYCYNVRVFKRRQDSKRPEMNYKGGYLSDKHGIPFFRVRTGFWWWEHKDLYELPDARYMDEDNRVCYELVSPGVWVQVAKTFIPVQEKMQEIMFLRDYAIYKAGTTAYIREEHVNLLLKDQIAKLTGQEKIVDGNDITYKPISNSDKKLIVTELHEAFNSLNQRDWKTTAAWIGGAVLIFGISILGYGFMSGWFK